MKAGCYPWQCPEDQVLGAEDPCQAGRGWLPGPGWGELCAPCCVLGLSSSCRESFGMWA